MVDTSGYCFIHHGLLKKCIISIVEKKEMQKLISLTDFGL